MALDFKATKSNFHQITKSNLFEEFEKSFDILLKSKMKFEIRTTYHSELISISNINKMILFLENKNYRGNYYIQSFRNNVETIGNLSYSSKIGPSEILMPSNFNIFFRN